MKTLEIYRNADGVLSMTATFDYGSKVTTRTGNGWTWEYDFPYFLYGYSDGHVDVRPESRPHYCGWCGGKFLAKDLYDHLRGCEFVLRDLLDDDRERYEEKTAD